MEVYRYPNSRFVANFIGRANFVDGIVVEKDQTALQVQSFSKVIHLQNVLRDFAAHDRVTLIVRPEMVRIKKSGELFEGIIRRAAYLGDVIEYDVEIGGQLLTGVETDPYVMEMFPVARR